MEHTIECVAAVEYHNGMRKGVGPLLVIQRQRGIRRENLAAAVGTSPSTVTRHLSGKISPERSMRVVYAREFGIALEEFDEMWLQAARAQHQKFELRLAGERKAAKSSDADKDPAKKRGKKK
jgi:hypothetical protein